MCTPRNTCFLGPRVRITQTASVVTALRPAFHPHSFRQSYPDIILQWFSVIRHSGPCGFWATVCKTVRPMPSDRWLSCLSVCNVGVYCGQTVGWISMPLGMEVGHGPGHVVLDGDQAFPKMGTAPLPNFRPMSVVAKRLDGSRYHLVKRLAYRPRRHCIRWEPSSPPKKSHSLPTFRPMSIVAKRRPFQQLRSSCYLGHYKYTVSQKTIPPNHQR